METWPLPDGAVTIREEGHAVRFRVDCQPPCESARLLRCYGENPDLLLGVLEPQNGRLVLDRRITRETLRQAGADGKLPDRFYLSDGGAREHASETTAISEEPAGRAGPEAAGAAEPETSAKAAEPETSAKAAPPTQSVEATLSPTEGALSPEEPPGTGKPPIPRTGDALLDAVLARGDARCESVPEGLRITCPFSPDQPFPLAFIAPLCRTEAHQIAVLDWEIPQGTP